MKTRKLFWMFTVTAMALLFVACAGNTPAPTVDPTALGKQATFDGGAIGGGFTVSYPNAWSHQVSEDGIRLSNDSNILNDTSDSDTFASGVVAISVSLTPRQDAQAFPTAESLLQGFMDIAATAQNAPSYGDIEAITLDGRAGAKALGTVAGSDSLLIALDLDGNYVLGFIVAPQGEVNTHMDTVNAIIESVVPSPAE